jgi:hypothetical protein
MEEEKLIQSISKSIGDKLKIPIILTYICVLILYNWDILFYLLFEKISASEKISFIKQNYQSEYYERIFICIGLSIFLIVLFTILNTLINFSLMWFYRKDKEISSKIERYEKINKLTEQLSNSIDEIKVLNSKITKLENINDELNFKKLDYKISDISKKDYDSLIKSINTGSDKEKYLYSLKELIELVKNKPFIELEKIKKNSTYRNHMIGLIDKLVNRSLISKVEHVDEQIGYYEGIEQSPSFKDFLKIDL